MAGERADRGAMEDLALNRTALKQF